MCQQPDMGICYRARHDVHKRMAAATFLCSTDEKVGLKKTKQNNHNNNHAKQQENKRATVLLHRSQSPTGLYSRHIIS